MRVHQAFAAFRRQVEPERRCSVTERVLSAPPEVGVVLCHDAQPRVVELTRAPGRDELGTATRKELLRHVHHRSWVEDGKRVEEDCIDSRAMSVNGAVRGGGGRAERVPHQKSGGVPGEGAAIHRRE
jgi:hypothetical protein